MHAVLFLLLLRSFCARPVFLFFSLQSMVRAMCLLCCAELEGQNLAHNNLPLVHSHCCQWSTTVACATSVPHNFLSLAVHLLS